MQDGLRQADPTLEAFGQSLDGLVADTGQLDIIDNFFDALLLLCAAQSSYVTGAMVSMDGALTPVI
jgi:hypothetical protein